MITDIERQRMLHAEYTLRKTNCIGTALYILGAIGEDSFVGAGEQRWESGIVDTFLKQYVKVETPHVGNVLVIRSRRLIEHMGIIVEDNPTKVYNRLGVNGVIAPQESLDAILNIYRKFPKYEFYSKEEKRERRLFYFF